MDTETELKLFPNRFDEIENLLDANECHLNELLKTHDAETWEMIWDAIDHRIGLMLKRERAD